MKFTTLVARFPGTCKRCRQPITVGQRIRYGGKGLTYHLADDCETARPPQAIGQPTLADIEADAEYYNAKRNTAAITPSAVTMTAELAQTIRQEFADLLARPANLLDPLADADDNPADDPTDNDIPPSFAAMEAAGVIEPIRKPTRQPASIDADLF